MNIRLSIDNLIAIVRTGGKIQTGVDGISPFKDVYDILPSFIKKIIT